MDRLILYPASIIQETDTLSVQRNTMVALGYLAQAVMGSGIVADGLTLAPTAPASMSLTVGPGTIFALSQVDPDAYGDLGTDADPVVKFGINTEPTTFTLTAPTSSGQSVNYLIEASLQETDGAPVVLPYYDANSPTLEFSGPNNSGNAQNTQRTQRVGLQLKAGAAANAGSQTTPAVDTGWTALYVVTVNYGQTAVTAANLASGNPNGSAMVPGAPFVDPLLVGRGIQPGRVINVQTFNTPGTFTYVRTPGAMTGDIFLDGAGGPGGGATATGSGQYSIGGGGGQGGHSERRGIPLPVTALVVVGAGGVPAPAPAAGVVGTTGGSSSFGTVASALGGASGLTSGPSAGGFVANPGSGASAASNNPLDDGGAPGVAGIQVGVIELGGNGGGRGGGFGSAGAQGGPGTAAGAGGGGSSTSPNSPALTGGLPGNGRVVIVERT